MNRNGTHEIKRGSGGIETSRRSILDASGNPISLATPKNGHANGTANGVAAPKAIDPDFAFIRTFGDIAFGDAYLNALNALGKTPMIRARDPYRTNPWVHVAANVIMSAASQAEFTLWVESDEELRHRRDVAERRGAKMWTPGRGADRRAASRWLSSRGLQRRIFSRGLEVDDGHPLVPVFQNPNPLQSKWQFFATTFLLLALKRECFWIKTDENDERVAPGDLPARLWPMAPELLEPIFETSRGGSVVKWRFTIPPEMPWVSTMGTYVDLDVDEVIQFRMPSPESLLRGMPAIVAAAGAIALDAKISAYNQALIDNGGAPSGILSSDLQGMKPEAEKELEDRWNEKYAGPSKAGRTAIMWGGLKWTSSGLPPKDMEYAALKDANKKEVMIAHGVTPSIVGDSEADSYATAAVRSKMFWTLTMIPMVICVEQTIDSKLMFGDPDSSVAAFDLSTVDALRAGITEKIAQAKEMSGETLHVPPTVAFGVVGIDVPKYEGDDVAFASALATPVKDVLSGGLGIDGDVPGAAPGSGLTPEGDPEEDEPSAPVGDGGTDPGDGADDGTEDPDDGDTRRLTASERATKAALSLPENDRLRTMFRLSSPFVLAKTAAARRAMGGKAWKRFVIVQSKSEVKLKNGYRGWAAEIGRKTLSNFDRFVKGKLAKSVVDAIAELVRNDFARAEEKKPSEADLSIIIPSPKDAANALGSVARPIFAGLTVTGYEMTAEDLGGVTVFSVTDEKIQGALESRIKNLASKKASDLVKDLKGTLFDAIKNGETVQQMRERIGIRVGLETSSARTLRIARTETSGYLNGVRDEMFAGAGVTKQDWVTAGDIAVRASHEVFGEHGEEDRGFNWLSLVDDAGGTLRFPGDPQAPAKEVVNCRCVMIPVE